MEPYYFYSGFSKEWYKFILEKNGLELKEIFYNGNFFKYILQENLRAISIVRNPLIKIIYGFLSIPKLVFDSVMSKFIGNTQFLFGFHILAVKK